MLKLESNQSNSSHMQDEDVDKVFNKKENAQKRHKQKINEKTRYNKKEDKKSSDEGDNSNDDKIIINNNYK